MKKAITLGLLLILFSCQEKVRILTPEQAKAVRIQAKIDEGNDFIERNYINEFEYKGHTYMYNEVKNGVCAWHAGHCKCNSKFR